MSTRGVEMMNQIADGSVALPPSEFLQTSVTQISQAAEELIEVGARIRPLLLNGKRVGWVRGIHLSERKALKRWVSDENEYITHLLRIGTTLTTDEINDLNLVELRSVSRVIRAMTDSDVRLFPYLSCFATTSTSEQLWYSRGMTLTSFTNRDTLLPDGKRIHLLCASDQAELDTNLSSSSCEAFARLHYRSIHHLSAFVVQFRGETRIKANGRWIGSLRATQILEFTRICQVFRQHEYDSV